MPIIKAILFDFDGVLVKTMETHFEAWKNAFKHYEINLKAEDYYPLEGMKLKAIAEVICQTYNKNINPDEIVKKKLEYYLNNKYFEIYPGVEDFLELLIKKNTPKGIVSASTYPQIANSIGASLLSKFEVIISGEHTGRGKPFPDQYLAAAEKLNLPPKECIVIENAPLGIMAAKSAGMYCIAIASTASKEKLALANEVVDSFKDINNSRIIHTLIC